MEKRCPPRPFNLAIRGNHFREFLGTRRPPPTPGFVNEEQKRSPISIQGGAGREDRDLWFYWLPQGWTLKMGRRAFFRHTRNSHRRPLRAVSTLSIASRSNRRAVQSWLVDPCCYALLSCPTRLCSTSLSFPPAQTGASRPRAAAAEGVWCWRRGLEHGGVVEKGVSRRLQAARLRVGPPEPHADNTCRGGWGRPRGRRGRGGRAPGGPAPAARRRAATSEAAGGEGWITRSRGDRRPSGEGGGWTTQRSLRPSREKTSRTTRATFSSG